MAVKEGNVRVIVTINKELKDRLEHSAITDKRTISKQVEYILEEYFNQTNNQEK